MASARPYVLATGVAAQVAAATVGVLPVVALPFTAAALIAVSRLTAPWTRNVATASAMLVALGAMPSILTAGGVEGLKSTLGLLLVAVQVAQAAGWKSTRDERAGLVTALGVLVLAASYSPDVLVGAPLLAGWVAALMALAHLAGVRGRQLWSASAVALVLGLVAFLLVPLPDRVGIRSRLAGGESSTPDQRAAAGESLFSGSRVDLSLRGPLSDAPVVAVPSDSPRLWRSAVYDVYDGAGWSRPDPDAGFDGSTFNVSTPTSATRSYPVTPVGAQEADVYAPGQLVRVTTDRGVHVTHSPDGDLVSFPSVPYTVTVQPEVTDPGRLTSTVGADVTDRRWRGVPVSTPLRVRALAEQITAGSTSRWDSAQRIADYLRGHAKYTLDSPVPAPGEDAVDRFLFVDRLGFCEQFASAEVVLLREVGIPARLVTGVAYGTERGATRTYAQKDLHAWAELWVPGAGWVTSDPTSGTELSAATTGLRARVAAAVNGALKRVTSLPGGRPAVALALLALLAVAAAVVVGVRGRRPARPTEVRAPVATGPALAAFLRLDGRLGSRRRRPAESLRELGSRLDPAVAEALHVVEQEVYGPTAPDATRAVEVLDRS